MVTRKRLSRLLLPRLLLCWLWLLAPLQVMAQDVEVSVSATEIAMGDTLEFQIRVHQRQPSPPDLTPLTESGDFEILSSSTSSQFRNFNNQVESWVDYEVELFPLHEGELVIPAIEVNGQITDPIAVVVLNRGANSNQPGNELFLETETNKDSVYVQEQLLFSIRLYYTINGIRNPQFTELDMPDTVIQMVGSPNQYERVINGLRYGVYEMRYVIFPQRSGPLEIPDIIFRGEVTDGSSNFVFRNPNTRRVTAFIEGTTVEVMERPEISRSVEYWLPASNITLEEEWSADPGSLQVGESIERTLTLTAEGLDGAMLPAFSPTQVEGANIYPDPAEIDRTFVEGQIVGSRVEAMSVVPTAEGAVTMPAINITWWDTDTSQLKSASLPERRLNIATVEGQLPAEQTGAASSGRTEPDAAPALQQEDIDSQSEATLIQIPRFWIDLVFALLVALFLVATYLAFARRIGFSLRAASASRLRAFRRHYSAEENESTAFRSLSQACRSGDFQRIRDALLTWARHYYYPEPIHSMDDLLRPNSDPDLRKVTLALQSGLYGGANSTATSRFDGAALLSIVSRLRGQHRQERRRQRRDADFILPPLYKT